MASIIKVDDVQDAAGNNIIREAADTITIGASGDTITIPSGATISNLGTASGFGKVGQVVQTVITTAQALSTSTSKIDLPDYTVAITPTAASSKILVEWYIMFSNDSGDRHLLYLNRGTTEIGIGTTSGLGELCTTGLMTANSNNYWAFNATGSYLDSPATTSATTYKFQINAGGSYTCHFNRTARGSADGCYISTMTATEIVA
jgi:hypothetical protein